MKKTLGLLANVGFELYGFFGRKCVNDMECKSGDPGSNLNVDLIRGQQINSLLAQTGLPQPPVNICFIYFDYPG